MDRAAEILRNIDNIVWGPFLLLFMLGTGIYLTVKMRFLPLRNLGYALKSVVTKDPNAKEGGKGHKSSFY